MTLRTSQKIYVPGEALEVFGTAQPNSLIVIRLYDPAGVAIRIENIGVDRDGSYRASIFVWPEPSRNFVFGTYLVEALSSIEGVEPVRTEVTYAGGFAQGLDPAQSHVLVVKLDAPNQVTVNSVFRIFVQVTFDGALVEADDDQAVKDILGTSHIHSRNDTIILSDRFRELHPGLYYADVMLEDEDTYVIHTTAFYRGFLSHDTRLITASASSIDTIQNSVNRLSTEVGKLNAGINSTAQELERLNEDLNETQSELNATKISITNSVDEAQESIREQIDLARQASDQINSLILPVLALISVIIALQISLFARIRASYR
jgi:outer membrane murein-binding lipoprotein Lpp